MLLDRYLEDRAEREIDTELYRRASAAKLSEISDLIAAGANPDAPVLNDLKEDFYAIHRAAMNPDIEVLKYFVSQGVNPCRYDFWSRQPLAFAVRKNPLEFTEYLVGLGNKADHVDHDDESVIAEAALNPHVEVLDYLIGLGADVNAGAQGDRPLELALKFGTCERMKYFVDYGAAIEGVDDLDFFCAPLANIRWLLEHGYNPNALDDFGTAKVIDHLDPARQALFMEFGGKVMNKDAEKYHLTYAKDMPKVND